jgi:hypothetical protein
MLSPCAIPELLAPLSHQAADTLRSGVKRCLPALGGGKQAWLHKLWQEASSQRLEAKLSRNSSFIRLGGINLRSLAIPAILASPKLLGYRSLPPPQVSQTIPIWRRFNPDMGPKFQPLIRSGSKQFLPVYKQPKGILICSALRINSEIGHCSFSHES